MYRIDGKLNDKLNDLPFFVVVKYFESVCLFVLNLLEKDLIMVLTNRTDQNCKRNSVENRMA